MRSVYEQRRENLRELMRTWGGPSSLAKKLGHSNGSYLASLAYEHAKLTGRIDEPFIQRLVRLTKS